MSKPLSIHSIPRGDLTSIRAVLTDIDDTLTLEGRLPATAYAALEKLHAKGIGVVPVTGRPAGWCDHIARMWPVDGVVGENGAFYFRYDQASRKMIRAYTQSEAERNSNFERLSKIVEGVLEKFPGTAIASDQAYREIDVAVDFCEDVPPLPLETAYAIAKMFHDEGAQAKVSSIHVNAWFGQHDKLSMALLFLRDCFGMSAADAKHQVAYCGDSPNDAPMFGYFDMGVGVANIAPFLDRIEHAPRYVTASAGGEGFAEFAELLIQSR
jgi:HAD superfamily hydrolase (TIGR01484 family)